MATADLTVEVNRRAVRRVLLAALGFIVLVHLYVDVTDGFDLVGETLSRRFSDVAADDAFPRWFSALLWALAAVLSWLVARLRPSRSSAGDWRWVLLAAGFAWLSIDEVASLHEALAGPLRTALSLEGALYYAWVIPAGLVAASLLAVYLHLGRALAPPVRWRLVLALALFVGAGVGLDLFDGPDTASTVVSIVEEIIEMGAVILIVDSLWLHLGSDRLVIQAAQSPTIAPERQPVAPAGRQR